MLKSVCVFCASSSKVDPVYLSAALELGDVCSSNGIHVFYGGGAQGLMGSLASQMIKKKGKVTGIIPDFMKVLQWAHTGVTEMIVVENMRERKRQLIENVDAVIALPGGIGTLEELLEVSTLKQLGLFTKPIFIINTNGYYDTLIAFMEEMYQKKFMHENNRGIWCIIQSPSELLTAYENTPVWNPDLERAGETMK